MQSYIVILFCLLSVHSNTWGQSIIFSFDDCTMNSNLGSGSFEGNPVCQCGLSGESVFFDGSNDGATLPDTVLKLMNGDFTIDMYVSGNNNGGDQIDLLAIGNDCGFDSLITIKRLLSSNEILVELINNNGEYYSLRRPWPDKCWNRITFVKFKLNYILYLNNVEAGRAIATQNIPFPSKAKFTISNGPCLSLADERFRGRIDELSIYTNAFTERDLVDTYLFPDALVSQDTTIFLGGSVDLNFGNSCAQNFSWSPGTGLSDTNLAEVTASPEITTTYTLLSNDNGCETENKITINVVDPDKIECKNLLLPNAFTPNGDRLNDTYGISNTFIVDELEQFEILDRWGGVMFKTTDKNEQWDGSFKGATVEPGVYTYRIAYTCKNEAFSLAGNFVIIK